MKKAALLFTLIGVLTISAQEKKKQILVIGTFHFSNPGRDVTKVKTFNVMSERSQQELENISNRIKDFGPDKIFVEWNHEQQPALDAYYKRDTDSLLKENTNEIVQLALRSAKKLKHKTLYAIDYNNALFPYDSLIEAMQYAGQQEMIALDDIRRKEYESGQNKKITSYTLTELLLDINSPEEDNENLGWYITFANRGGNKDSFAGAYLVSEWYRRNIYMYSQLQKITSAEDDKVMVLLGAGHTALLRDLIRHDATFEIVELKDILK
jgi:hypothetical protein